MIPGLGFVVRFVVGKLSAKTRVCLPLTILLMDMLRSYAQREHFRFSADRVDRRLQIDPSKADFWTFAMRGEKGLSVDELHSNSQVFMIAGTETSATLLR